MKLYNFTLAAIAIAIALCFGTPTTFAQSNDTINGWYFHSAPFTTLDTVNVDSAAFSVLTTDRIQGSTAQLFHFNVLDLTYPGHEDFGVYWEKQLNQTYVTPDFISSFNNVWWKSGAFSVALGIYLVHGDTVYLVTMVGLLSGWESRTSEVGGNPPSSFDKIRFLLRPTSSQGSANIIIDSLVAVYPGNVRVLLDPFENPPIFSAVPSPLVCDTTILTASSTKLLTAYANGSTLPLSVDSVTSTSPAFSVAPSNTTIAPNDSAVFTVTFTPPDTGNITGALVFYHHNGTTLTDTVLINGTCTIPQSATIVRVSYNESWNMVSLPLLPAPGTTVPINFFRYSGSYVVADSMEPGIGYWYKSQTAAVVTFVGTVYQDSFTLPVKAHWNIIGMVSTPTAVTKLGSIPDGLTVSNFFGYNGINYFVADTLFPGKAYWVKAAEDGKIIVQQPQGSALAKVAGYGPIRIVADGELPPPPPGGTPSTGSGPSVGVPTEFQLEQNYPNPFNPATEIRFEVPVSGFVSLKVYDVLGREVATLVQEQKTPGSYSAQWDAVAVTSGVYYYRLASPSSVEVRKMVLIK